MLDEIAAERRRQIAKGYDAAHDDAHKDGAILHADWGAQARLDDAIDATPDDDNTGNPVLERRKLIEAAALIVAEIERLDRAEGQPDG